MTPIQKTIINKKTTNTPIWLMRQAGRYLPEFREIRKLNPDFINLCLNENLSSEITLQPLKRFELDAAIIFSDILMLPYGLNQKVEFKKNFGPQLGPLNLDQISKVDEIDFIEKLYPVYKSIKKVSENNLIKNKNVIGFVGAPWTLLVYMINKHSPKKELIKDFFKDEFLINRILIILEKFLKLHINQQIKNGATVIQIFDSWAGLLKEKDLPTSEDANLNPMSPYALHKLVGEQYCKLFSELYGLETACLRYFNVYGERQATEGAYCLVMGVFAQQLLTGGQMTINGDGENRRDFTYVGDVVDANIKAGFNAKIPIFKCDGDVFNIGNGDNRSINEIADMIGDNKVNVEPVIEPPETLADNSKARELLGYSTATNMRQSVKKTAEYIRTRGTKKFQYHLPLEIINDKTPDTWKNKLI